MISKAITGLMVQNENKSSAAKSNLEKADNQGQILRETVIMTVGVQQISWTFV